MKVEKLKNNLGKIIEGPLLLKPKLINDSRGFFYESWNNKIFNSLVNEDISFVQDNHSRSTKGVLRGLHYQLPPYPQGKLVKCINGDIFDIAVDLRSDSKSFSEWTGAMLTSNNHSQLWIPKGFAHGFITLSNYADVLYKVSNIWSKECERTIRWDDPTININWPKTGIDIQLSEKDETAPFISQLNSNDFF
tara:strand:+ start:808 stop:1383 length:576 start_codon:yes stop_codon:yes gene_type:complete